MSGQPNLNNDSVEAAKRWLKHNAVIHGAAPLSGSPYWIDGKFQDVLINIDKSRLADYGAAKLIGGES